MPGARGRAGPDEHTAGARSSVCSWGTGEEGSSPAGGSVVDLDTEFCLLSIELSALVSLLLNGNKVTTRIFPIASNKIYLFLFTFCK